MKVYTDGQIDVALWAIDLLKKDFLTDVVKQESFKQSLNAIAEILRRGDSVHLMLRLEDDEQ